MITVKAAHRLAAETRELSVQDGATNHSRQARRNQIHFWPQTGSRWVATMILNNPIMCRQWGRCLGDLGERLTTCSSKREEEDEEAQMTWNNKVSTRWREVPGGTQSGIIAAVAVCQLVDLWPPCRALAPAALDSASISFWGTSLWPTSGSSSKTPIFQCCNTPPPHPPSFTSLFLY